MLPLSSKRLDRQSKISISAAVALLGLYMLYNKITKPPRPLRHLSRVSPFASIRALLQSNPSKDISQELTLSVELQSMDGVYVVVFGWSVHILRPETAKKMLLKTDAFQKAFVDNDKASLLGRMDASSSIVALNDAHWKSQRMVANPAFHRSMPIKLFGRLTAKLFGVIDENIDRGSASMDFHDLTDRWTLDAIGLAGSGFNFNAIADHGSEWVTRYSVIAGNMLDPLFLTFSLLDRQPLFSFFPKRRKAHQEVTRFIQMINEVIARKKRTLCEDNHILDNIKDNEKDLLTLMIEAGKEGQGSLSVQELRGNLILFFIAGHDTTSNALAYAIYHLAVNQDIQKRAREQVISVLGDEAEDIAPTAEQSSEMTYINMIIKETLRFNPPVGQSLPREAARDTELAGTLIPKGTAIFTEIYELHHNPNVWKDPETFDPERFATGEEAEKLGSAAWQPFITGPRQCLGMNFSLAEQRVFLPMLLRKYEWRLPEYSIHKNGIATTGTTIIGPKDLDIVFKRRY
ncbi:cytochrome P450 [Fennellomyces sp. T-0311]|nr:cytochrome P450 [Fennellomyces sp. T-0311]